MLLAPEEPLQSTEFVNAQMDSSSPTNALLPAQLDMEQSVDNALNALLTVLHAQDLNNTGSYLKMDQPVIWL